jgi:O-antigen/teichoic acid export membrane protein
MKNVTQSFVAAAVIQLANIASGIQLARILLPEGRGELAAAMLWPALIASLGILGIHEAVTYHAARRTRGNDVILVSSLVLGCGLAAILAVVGYGIVDVALAGHRPQTLHAAHLYLAFIPINFICLFVVGLLQGAMRFTEWNILRVLVHVAYALLIPAFYLLDATSVAAFASASLLANGLTVAVGIAMVAARGWLRPARPAALRELGAYGIKAHVGTMSQVIGEYLDQMVISVFLSATSLGLYVVALGVARLAAVPATTLGMLAFPKIARAGSIEEQKETFGQYLRLTLMLTLAGAIAIMLCADWIVAAFFGRSFIEAARLAQILAVASFLTACKSVVSSGLKGMNALGAVGRGEIAGLVVSGATLALLLPLLGVLGAALAVVFAQAAAVTVMAAGVRRHLGTSLLQLLRPSRVDFRGLAKLAHTLRVRYDTR